MKFRIGVDIIEIERISRYFEKNFYSERMFSVAERKEAEKRHDKIQYYAKRFAGKEAVFKCLSGFSEGHSWSDISILTHKNGSPYVYLSDRLDKELKRRGYAEYEFQISLSSERNYAIAEALMQYEVF